MLSNKQSPRVKVQPQGSPPYSKQSQHIFGKSFKNFVRQPKFSFPCLLSGSAASGPDPASSTVQSRAKSPPGAIEARCYPTTWKP